MRDIDGLHAKYPKQPVGISEYGAGAALSDHTDNPLGGPPTPYGTPARRAYQPEEYAAFVHERNYEVLASRPFVWGTYVWAMFDFGSGIRNEGDLRGVNTKGLVTFDRQTRKDPFYFYKANWSAEPVTHIVGRRYTDRAYATTDVKVYSNADGGAARRQRGAVRHADGRPVPAADVRVRTRRAPPGQERHRRARDARRGDERRRSGVDTGERRGRRTSPPASSPPASRRPTARGTGPTTSSRAARAARCSSEGAGRPGTRRRSAASPRRRDARVVRDVPGRPLPVRHPAGERQLPRRSRFRRAVEGDGRSAGACSTSKCNGSKAIAGLDVLREAGAYRTVVTRTVPGHRLERSSRGGVHAHEGRRGGVEPDDYEAVTRAGPQALPRISRFRTVSAQSRTHEQHEKQDKHEASATDRDAGATAVCGALRSWDGIDRPRMEGESSTGGWSNSRLTSSRMDLVRSTMNPTQPEQPGTRSTSGASPRIPRQCPARRWRWLALPIGVLALFYGAVGYWGSGLMIGEQPRWRGMTRGPHDFGLQAEVVSLRSLDGIPLKAWWLPAQATPRATVIIAHGIDHTRQVMLPRAAFLVRGGYNVLAVDLRGHGESGGHIASPGLLERRDLLGALRYVRSRGEHGSIALFGVSYGAVACLLAAGESPEIQAVVSDGAFPTGTDVFRNVSRYYLQVPGRKLWVRGLFAAASLPGVAGAIGFAYYLRTGVYLGSDLVSVLPAASRIVCPVLLISGERDWMVPAENARRILAALPGSRKSLVNIPNAFHDTTYSTAPLLYEKAVLTFLNSVFAK